MTAGPATILLVEDNDEVRAFLRKELSEPHRVTVAANRTEAWNQIQADPPDLLLCDEGLPEGSGRALGRRVKEEDDIPRIPVFLLAQMSSDDGEESDSGKESSEEADSEEENSEEEDAEEESSGEESSGNDEPENDEAREDDAWADEVLEKPFSIAEARHHIDRYLPSPDVPDLRDTGGAFLKEALWTIERRLHDPEFKVQDLADEMDLSRRHLTRRLKEETNMTPATLIRTRRLERAKRQLEENPDKIGEVSETVGFHSPSHFSQAFRDEMGCSPSAYRERHAT